MNTAKTKCFNVASLEKKLGVWTSPNSLEKLSHLHISLQNSTPPQLRIVYEGKSGWSLMASTMVVQAVEVWRRQYSLEHRTYSCCVLANSAPNATCGLVLHPFGTSAASLQPRNRPDLRHIFHDIKVNLLGLSQETPGDS